MGPSKSTAPAEAEKTTATPSTTSKPSAVREGDPVVVTYRTNGQGSAEVEAKVVRVHADGVIDTDKPGNGLERVAPWAKGVRGHTWKPAPKPDKG